MSDRGPTSPDDPEWVDEIVRRALERAGADDANAPTAPPGAAPAVSEPPVAAAPPVASEPPVAATPPVAPEPEIAAPPPVAAAPNTPAPAPTAQPATAPTAAEPPPARAPEPETAATPAHASRVDDLFGAPAAAAEEPRLPEVDDLVSAYPLDDAASAAEVAGATASADPAGPYPDLDHDPRFDEAVGLGADPDFEGDPMGSRMRGFLEWGAVVVGALAVALIIKTFLMQAYFIPSSSMEPTLQIGDRVLVNKLSYDFGDIGRGDLIVFHRPPTQQEGEDDLIKRVIALEGERIEIRDGEVFITVAGSSEQQLLQEPYLPDGVRTTGFVDDENCVDPTPTSCGIPDGHIFVMGDNRGGSRDGRFFGPISEDLVVGRAFMRVWPIGDVGFL